MTVSKRGITLIFNRGSSIRNSCWRQLSVLQTRPFIRNLSKCSNVSDRSNIIRNREQMSSPPEATPSIDDISDNQKDGVFTKSANQSYFPWRHSPEPLDRLNPKHEDFVTKGPSGEGWPAYVQAFQMVYVGRELGLPLWKTVLTVGWQGELAKEFAKAFSIAVGALVSDRFSVDVGDILHEEEDGSVMIDFDSVTPDNVDILETNKSATVDSSDKEEVESGKNEEDEVSLQMESKKTLELMLEENLQKLYQASKEFGNANSMQVKLRTRPIGCRLVSASVIPFVTREDVKANSSLGSALLDLRDQFAQVEKNRNSMNDLLLDARKWFERETGHKERRTIVIQVEINCMEVFYVRDVVSDSIIQGNPLGTEQEVKHLVRFEMVTEEGELDKIPLISLLGPPEKRILGSWNIADWDDLLDGNIWYEKH